LQQELDNITRQMRDMEYQLENNMKGRLTKAEQQITLLQQENDELKRRLKELN